ncbi:MAG: ABC transporter ATP-binding protein [Oscillospiraceae bacterium]|nr:ABC transporter ATP-binding protein [Oscillospiraceae bacterium]
MIEVKNLSKSFEGFKALDGLSITVPKGSVYGLVGPNGSGKSTLIRHIMGIYRPDGGEILVDGKPVYENPEVKGRLGYIPDDIFYFTQANIMDMMKYYSSVYPSFSRERFDKLSEVFRLDPKKPIRKMSKGMQKQCAFHLCMSLCPDYVILDEPVDGLDPVMRRQVWSILSADVAEHGTTVLVSSHNLRELEDVCDRVGIIDKGSVILERSLLELQDNMCKIQAVFPEGSVIPPELEVLKEESTGKLRTLIMRGNASEIEDKLSLLEPVYMEALPLSLEEIFVYELGGADYAVKEIVL